MAASKSIYSSFNEYVEAGNKERSKPVSNKWIYVFRTAKDDKMYWYAEIYADNSGKYQLINLKDEMNRQKDKREVLNTKKDKVMLLYEERGGKVNNFFCLSRIQLPFKRIMEILLSFETLLFQKTEPFETNSSISPIYRAMQIPVHKSSSNSTVSTDHSEAIVYLTDYFSEAQRLNDLYVSKRDEYLTWVYEEKMDEKYLSDIINDICMQKKSFWKHLREKGSPLKDWLSAYKDDEKYRIEYYDKECAQLSKWLDKKEFCAVLEDYESGDDDLKIEGEKEYSRVIQHLCESNPGRLYFAKTYKNATKDENSWLGKWLFHSGRKAHEAFWQIVEQLSTTIVSYEAEPIQSFIDIAHRRTDTVLHYWTHAKTPSERAIFSHLMAEQAEFQVEYVNVKKGGAWAKNLEDAHISHALKSAIVVFDIALSCKVLNQSKTTEGYYIHLADLGRALVDMVMFAVEILKTRFGKKLIPVLGMISGVIEAITGGWECYHNVREGDYDAAVGFGFVSVGSVATFVGFGMLKLGLATSTTIVGIPLAAIITILGAAAVGVGFLIVAFCDDSDLEEWLEHCHWGDTYGGPGERDWSEGSFARWIGDLEVQIRALHNILFNYKIHAGIYTYRTEPNHPVLAEPWHSEPLAAKNFLYPSKLASDIQRRRFKDKGIGIRIMPTILTATSKITVDLSLDYYDESSSPAVLKQRTLAMDLELEPTFSWVNTLFMGSGSNIVKCEEEKKKIGSDMRIRDLVVFFLDNKSPVPIKAKKLEGLDALIYGSAAINCICRVSLDIYGDGKHSYKRRLETVLTNSYKPDDPFNTYFWQRPHDF